MTRRISLMSLLLAAIFGIGIATGTASQSASSSDRPHNAPQGANTGAANRAETARPGPRLENLFVTKETNGTLFDNVVSVLESRYYDKTFRSQTLPTLASEYSEKAKKATTLAQQREVVEELLGRIPSSHLGLLSKNSHHDMILDLLGRAYPTFGFQLIQMNGNYYAFDVWEGGPAVRAGVLPWDKVISIDGAAVAKSPRLDWRSDDAHLGDDRDPPVHYLMADKGDSIRVRIERSRGKSQNLTIPAEEYSALDAAKASARVLKSGAHTFGYLHLWYVHVSGADQLLQKELEGDLANCDGFIFDLRGRGGSAFVIAKIIAILKADQSTKHRPIIALVDRQSRSAKDVLAYELKRTGLARLVGEPTAGAVIPVSFADVGHDSILMFPTFKLPLYTDILESKPVQPDVFVERAGPLSGGNDPILKAGIAEATRLLSGAAKQATAH